MCVCNECINIMSDAIYRRKHTIAIASRRGRAAPRPPRRVAASRRGGRDAGSRGARRARVQAAPLPRSGCAPPARSVHHESGTRPQAQHAHSSTRRSRRPSPRPVPPSARPGEAPQARRGLYPSSAERLSVSESTVTRAAETLRALNGDRCFFTQCCTDAAAWTAASHLLQ